MPDSDEPRALEAAGGAAAADGGAPIRPNATTPVPVKAAASPRTPATGASQSPSADAPPASAPAVATPAPDTTAALDPRSETADTPATAPVSGDGAPAASTAPGPVSVPLPAPDAPVARHHARRVSTAELSTVVALAYPPTSSQAILVHSSKRSGNPGVRIAPVRVDSLKRRAGSSAQE